ncbi:hypothetical protein FJ420_21340 [Mesorhizobium sp. B3-1-3]|uniref:hypothetical protein n=1 Tax=unclassified Mesorhizobium TaxID=325217 RepID=UPI001129E758|nr:MULTISPECIES: hypothetical protein [unclassified Mesorhizobium]TPI59855.1 hypothetical protein FJ424_24735 [Mesorhizobium sp. B3-1-8]TPI68233.1 hypothetical protein FJ420_21340 [Mesorhizobium sp. B3-1-3]
MKRHHPFARKLSPENFEILKALASASASEPNWFRDALDDPEVFFALRNNRVDAYSRGALIYRIDFRAGKAVPHTHVKYLIREPRNERAYIAMRGGAFDYDPQARMQTDYRPGQTLKEIKGASYAKQSESYGGLSRNQR